MKFSNYISQFEKDLNLNITNWYQKGMPQIKSNNHITCKATIFMIAIKIGSRFKKPSLKKSYPIPDIKDDYVKINNLSNTILYACSSCDGPLVPITNCVFCKKAVTRKCMKCNKTNNFGSHELCEILIHYGSMVFSNSHKDNQ